LLKLKGIIQDKNPETEKMVLGEQDKQTLDKIIDTAIERIPGNRTSTSMPERLKLTYPWEEVTAFLHDTAWLHDLSMNENFCTCTHR
jgi:hypothetical protein